MRNTDSSRPQSVQGSNARAIALEQRMLLDAAAARTAHEVLHEAHGHTLAVEKVAQHQDLLAAPSHRPASAVVFIDTSIPDYQSLIQGISHDAVVYFIDGTQDGVAQMAADLAGSTTKYQSIQIYSHGTDGEFRIGGSLISLDTVYSHAADFAAIGSHLVSGGDILLYGCSIAGNADGKQLVNDIASLTGADVAASTDNTGSTKAGGNWNLEYSTGDITATSALSRHTRDTYASLLTLGWTDVTALLNADYKSNTQLGSSVAYSDQNGWIAVAGSRPNITGTYSQTGTTITMTTSAPTGVAVGDTVKLTFTSGTATTGTYTVATVTDSTHFTVTSGTSTSTSGNETTTTYGDNVYVYMPLGGGNFQETQITAPALETGATSVAIDGQFVIIGYPSANTAYIYKWNGSAWTQVASLSGSGGFGTSVAIQADPTNGWYRALVGAPQYNSGVVGQGGVYTYFSGNSGTTWTTSTIISTNDGYYDNLLNFGTSVAIDGQDVIIGAPGWGYHTYNSGSSTYSSGVGSTSDNQNIGRAYLYNWTSGSAAIQDTTIDAIFQPDGVSNNNTSSGASQAPVTYFGAYNASPDVNDNAAPSGIVGARFGTSVDVSVNGNTQFIAIGSPNEAGNGEVYTFTNTGGVPGTWGNGQDLVPGLAAGSKFGQSVSVDAYTGRLVVGAPGYTPSGQTAGSGGVWAFTTTLPTPGTWTSDSGALGTAEWNGSGGGAMGTSVALAKDMLVIGQPGNDLSSSTLNNGLATVKIFNKTPAPVNDTATTTESSSVTANVLANDTDPNNVNIDRLSIVGYPTPGNYSQAAGSTTVTINTSLPPGLVAGSTVTLTFTATTGTAPPAGTYTVASVGSASYTVTTAVAAGSATSGTEMTTVPFTGSTVTVNQGDAFTLDSLTFNPNGAYDWLSNGSSTTVTIPYTVQDGGGEYAYANLTVTITGVENPITFASGLASEHGNAAQTTSYALPAGTFTDVDTGDTNTYGFVMGSTWTQSGTTITVTTPAANSLAVGNPVYLNFTTNASGTLPASQSYIVTGIAGNTFTVTSALSQTVASSAVNAGTRATSLTIDSYNNPGNTLTFTLNGANGTMTFSPPAGYAGYDYTLPGIAVSDGLTASYAAAISNSFNVHIDRTNVAPTLVAPTGTAALTATEESSYSGSVTSYFTDADFSQPAPFNTESLTYSLVSQNGTALPAFLSLSPTTGALSGTPQEADVTTFGTYSQSGTTTVTVTAPSNGLSVGNNVYLNFTSGTLAAGWYTVATVTSSSVFTVTAAAAATTSGNVALPDVFTVRATDQFGLSVDKTIQMTVANVNDPPIVTGSITNLQASLGTAYTNASDAASLVSIGAPAASTMFADTDRPTPNTFTYSATFADGVALGTVGHAGSWLQFDPTTGRFYGTPPTTDAIGSVISVKVTATDNGTPPMSTSYTFNITEVPQPGSAGYASGTSPTDSTSFANRAGYNVAVSEDGLWMAVGEPGYDLAGSSSGGYGSIGRVAIYDWSGTAWTLVTRLADPNNTANDQFGYSLDWSSDGTKLVVGAPGVNSSAGAVYSWTRTAGTTTFTAATTYMATKTNTGTYSQTGTTITMTSGSPTGVAVGDIVKLTFTSGTATTGNYTVATVTDSTHFTVTSGTSTSTSGNETTTTYGNANDMFGFSVALDRTGTQVLVGAPGDSGTAFGAADTAANQTGAVYLATWGTAAPVAKQVSIADTGDTTQIGDRFGWSVAFEGGLAAVGSPFDSNNGMVDNGSVTVLGVSGTGFGTGTNITKKYGAASWDLFGYSVAMDTYRLTTGSAADSSVMLVVGAPNHAVVDSSGNTLYGAGSVYTYRLENQASSFGTSTNWTTTPLALMSTDKAYDAQAYDGFGQSVALDVGSTAANFANDVKDNGVRMVVGSETSGTTAGSIYVFHELSNSTWVGMKYLQNNSGLTTPSPVTNQFGWTVAISEAPTSAWNATYAVATGAAKVVVGAPNTYETVAPATGSGINGPAGAVYSFSTAGSLIESTGTYTFYSANIDKMLSLFGDSANVVGEEEASDLLPGYIDHARKSDTAFGAPVSQFFAGEVDPLLLLMASSTGPLPSQQDAAPVDGKQAPTKAAAGDKKTGHKDKAAPEKHQAPVKDKPGADKPATGAQALEPAVGSALSRQLQRHGARHNAQAADLVGRLASLAG